MMSRTVEFDPIDTHAGGERKAPHPPLFLAANVSFPSGPAERLPPSPTPNPFQFRGIFGIFLKLGRVSLPEGAWPRYVFYVQALLHLSLIHI